MNWLGQRIIAELDPDDSVLDIGSGSLSIAGKLPVKCHMGVDIYEPAVRFAIENGVPAILGCAPACLGVFPDSSYDVVLLIDVVEHLVKERSGVLIQQAERIAARRVYVFTPDGFVPNPARVQEGVQGVNKHQEHLCGWTADEMRQRGYEIFHHTNRDFNNRQFMAMLAWKDV